jgi:hypothetical protein
MRCESEAMIELSNAHVSEMVYLSIYTVAFAIAKGKHIANQDQANHHINELVSVKTGDHCDQEIRRPRNPSRANFPLRLLGRSDIQ